MFAQGAFQIDPNLTPEEVAARRQRLADARPKYGQARFVGEGLGQLGQGIAEGLVNRRLNKTERAGREGATSLFDRIIQGGGNRGGGMSILGMQPDVAASAAPPPVQPLSEEQALAADARNVVFGQKSPYADAIASIESAGSGDYAALGPQTKSGDRAYGKYQVMGSNIGPWTEKHLGRRMTPEQFLASPEAQDAVFNAEFGSYVDKYGNPQDAASMWFSGRPMDRAGNASDGYNTVPQYVDKFTKALGGQQTKQQPSQLNDLYAALQNPWLNQQQKAVLTQMIATEQQKADPAAQLDMEYKRAQLDALRNPVTKPAPRPMTAQDRATWGIPADDARPYALVDGKPTLIGGTGTTINNSVGPSETEYDKTIGKGFAEKYNTIQDSANAARGKMDTLTALGAALDESGTTGFGAETLMGVKRAAKSLGMDIGENLGPQETAVALGNQLALMLRNPSSGAGMPGAMSDKDRQFLVASVPGLGKTPQGNRQLLEYMKKVEQRNIEVAARAQDYAHTHGRLDAGFDRELAAWADANPLFGDAATAKPDAAGGPWPTEGDPPPPGWDEGTWKWLSPEDRAKVRNNP